MAHEFDTPIDISDEKAAELLGTRTDDNADLKFADQFGEYFTWYIGDTQLDRYTDRASGLSSWTMTEASA